jgi:MtN3 and saliva related transmembrane protein
MKDYLGYVAAILTTIAFIPQAIKIYKEKSAKSLSLKTFYVFTAGVFFWLMYGIALASPPMIVANSITISLSIAILILKHRYDHTSTREKPKKMTNIKKS